MTLATDEVFIIAIAPISCQVISHNMPPVSLEYNRNVILVLIMLVIKCHQCSTERMTVKLQWLSS